MESIEIINVNNIYEKLIKEKKIIIQNDTNFVLELNLIKYDILNNDIVVKLVFSSKMELGIKINLFERILNQSSHLNYLYNTVSF